MSCFVNDDDHVDILLQLKFDHCTVLSLLFQMFKHLGYDIIINNLFWMEFLLDFTVFYTNWSRIMSMPQAK